MAEPILWATLIIASASLIFAGIAFRQVMKTSKSVDGFLVRADKILNKFMSSAKGMFTPEFMGDTISHTLTKGLKNPDGTQVSMAQYVNGYVVSLGPLIYQDLKKEIPNYIPLLLSENPSLGGPPNPQARKGNGQWGSGGLDAAKKLGKAVKKVPFGEKIAEYVEGAQALVHLGGTLRELKNEVMGAKGGNGDTDGSSAPRSDSEGSNDWGPPF
jgi:hypothetical protein